MISNIPKMKRKLKSKTEKPKKKFILQQKCQHWAQSQGYAHTEYKLRMTLNQKRTKINKTHIKAIKQTHPNRAAATMEPISWQSSMDY